MATNSTQAAKNAQDVDSESIRLIIIGPERKGANLDSLSRNELRDRERALIEHKYSFTTLTQRFSAALDALHAQEDNLSTENNAERRTLNKRIKRLGASLEVVRTKIRNIEELAEIQRTIHFEAEANLQPKQHALDMMDGASAKRKQKIDKLISQLESLQLQRDKVLAEKEELARIAGQMSRLSEERGNLAEQKDPISTARKENISADLKSLVELGRETRAKIRSEPTPKQLEREMKKVGIQLKTLVPEARKKDNKAERVHADAIDIRNLVLGTEKAAAEMKEDKTLRRLRTRRSNLLNQLEPLKTRLRELDVNERVLKRHIRTGKKITTLGEYASGAVEAEINVVQSRLADFESKARARQAPNPRRDRVYTPVDYTLINPGWLFGEKESETENKSIVTVNAPDAVRPTATSTSTPDYLVFLEGTQGGVKAWNRWIEGWGNFGSRIFKEAQQEAFADTGKLITLDANTTAEELDRIHWALRNRTMKAVHPNHPLVNAFDVHNTTEEDRIKNEKFIASSDHLYLLQRGALKYDAPKEHFDFINKFAMGEDVDSHLLVLHSRFLAYNFFGPTPNTMFTQPLYEAPGIAAPKESVVRTPQEEELLRRPKPEEPTPIEVKVEVVPPDAIPAPTGPVPVEAKVEGAPAAPAQGILQVTEL